MKFAHVHGWGAVEKKAAEWGAGANAIINEILPQLWAVTSGGEIIGYIGKGSWTVEGIEREGKKHTLGF